METDILQTMLVVGIAALYIPACFLIARKAGYSGWLSLLMIIPVVNLLVIYIFAFADWPVVRQIATGDKLTRPERLPKSGP